MFMRMILTIIIDNNIIKKEKYSPIHRRILNMLTTDVVVVYLKKNIINIPCNKINHLATTMHKKWKRCQLEYY